MLRPTGINNKLRFVGGSLSFVVIAAIVLAVFMNEKSKKDSLIINIAGKQRMLTQKISKEIFYNVHKDSTDFRAVDSAMALFESSLHDLMEGNSAKGIYPPQNEKILEKLKKVKELWKPFKNEIVAIEKNLEAIKPDLDVFITKVNTILELSNSVVKKMVRNHMEGVYIDLSGRQRMLSQRMSLFLERYLRTTSKEDLVLYESARKLYDKTITSFLNDEKVKSNDEVYEATKIAYNYWKEFEKYANKLIKNEESINAHLNYIYKNNIKILNTMDEAVWLFTDYSEEKNSIFIYMQFISLSIALIIILYSFVLSKEIVNHMQDFISKAKALATSDITKSLPNKILLTEENEDELLEASSHINSFVSKVNLALEHSQDAVSKAEKAVKELENLSENVEDMLLQLDLDESDKRGFDKRISATEDIAIESTENLLHVTKMLKKLKMNLDSVLKTDIEEKS